MEEEKTVRGRHFRISRVSATLFVCFVVALGASGFFYTKYKNATKGEVNKTAVLSTLSKTIHLPSEEPMAVTVADKSKLANQALAARVENGDTLFIYSKARRLVVYRPSTKKVVDMLTVGNPQELPAEDTPATKKTKPVPRPAE